MTALGGDGEIKLPLLELAVVLASSAVMSRDARWRRRLSPLLDTTAATIELLVGVLCVGDAARLPPTDLV